jgi:hypothetical protein
MNAPNRHCFQFSLRAMFVLVAVIGACSLWMMSQFEAVREREKLVNARAKFDMSNPDQSRLPFVWSLFGASPVNSIGLPAREFSDDDRVHYRSAFPEADVTLEDRPFDLATYSRKRWANRNSQDRKWTEAWITARSVLETLAAMAVVALAFELVRPNARHLGRSTH